MSQNSLSIPESKAHTPLPSPASLTPVQNADSTPASFSAFFSKQSQLNSVSSALPLNPFSQPSPPPTNPPTSSPSSTTAHPPSKPQNLDDQTTKSPLMKLLNFQPSPQQTPQQPIDNMQHSSTRNHSGRAQNTHPKSHSVPPYRASLSQTPSPVTYRPQQYSPASRKNTANSPFYLTTQPAPSTVQMSNSPIISDLDYPYMHIREQLLNRKRMLNLFNL